MAADHNGDVRLAFGFNTLTEKPEAFYRATGTFKWQICTKVILIYVDTYGLSTPNFFTFTHA